MKLGRAVRRSLGARVVRKAEARYAKTSRIMNRKKEDGLKT